MKLSSNAGNLPLPSPSRARLSSGAATPAVASAVAAQERGVSFASPKKAPAPAVNRVRATREVVIERQPKKQGAASGGSGGGKNEDAPKKRVRLKPETPEQLLERLRNPQLSLHEASILLRVSRATVRRYADSGRLNCQRTPGGQRRFFLRDIENFYRQLKLKR